MQGIKKRKKEKDLELPLLSPAIFVFYKATADHVFNEKGQHSFIVMTTATQNVTRQNGCTKMTSSRTSQEAF